MQTNAIQGTQNSSGVLSTSQSSFEDDTFLRLLVTQLQQQTPLDPVDNASFNEQLAQFSAIEQQRELNTNLLALLDYQGALARIQGLGEGSVLLGKEVDFVRADGTTGEGIVDSVVVTNDGTVELRIGNESIDLRGIVAIRQPGTGGTNSTPTGTTGNGGTGTSGNGSTGTTPVAPTPTNETDPTVANEG